MRHRAGKEYNAFLKLFDKNPYYWDRSGTHVKM